MSWAWSVSGVNMIGCGGAAGCGGSTGDGVLGTALRVWVPGEVIGGDSGDGVPRSSEGCGRYVELAVSWAT
jgi:hypothetical protein